MNSTCTTKTDLPNTGASGRIISILAAMLVLPGSCRLLFPNYLMVESYTPRSEVVSNLSPVSIGISFNAAVNKASVENAFSFSVDSVEKSGRIRWINQWEFEFIPDEPLGTGITHSLRLENECEDMYGISLEKAFEHSFRTSADSTRPSVLTVFPADNHTIDTPDSDLSLQFSEPMDWMSVVNAISISPAFTYSYAVDDTTNTITLSHNQDLNWQQEYIVAVDVSAADQNGNTMATDFSSRFFIGSDTDDPSLTSLKMGPEGSESTMALNPTPIGTPVINSGIESFWDMQLNFSETVSTDSLDSHIQLSPPLPLSIENGNQPYLDRVIVRFDKAPVHGIRYQLILNAGYEDVQENGGNEAVFYFDVDGPDSVPPMIRFLALYTGSIPSYQIIYRNGTISAPPPDFSSFSGTTSHFALYLRLSQTADQNLDKLKWSIIDNWRISPSNSCVRFDTILDAVVDPATVPPELSAAYPNPPPDEVLVFLYYTVTTSVNSGFIDYTLLDGFSDGLDLPIAKQWSIRVDK